jgi:putative transposase
MYQGRFKSFRMQTDEHCLTVARYVERNALWVKLVNWAEAWQWSSLWRRTEGAPMLTAWLSAWPVARPRDWIVRVNRPETALGPEALRLSVQQGGLLERTPGYNVWRGDSERNSRSDHGVAKGS